jgi:hypothetical protein
MPRLTRWYLRAALLYLVTALALFSWEAAGPFGFAAPRGIGPLSFHLLVVGFVTELIFGVVYWMFPPHSKARPRGDERLAWTTYVLLNLGLWMRVVGEPFSAARAGGPWGGLLVGSALLQWTAGLLFVLNTWPRVKAR